MGSRGPLPQSDNVRQLRGNPGKRSGAEPSPRAVRGIPDIPELLSEEAKAEWGRITPELDRLGILTRIDRGILSMYCQAWGAWVEVTRIIEEEGHIIKGTKGDRKHPAIQLQRDYSNTAMALAKELGVSPNARLRMKAPEPEPGDESDLD